jgi:hypothetical protein
MGPSPPIIISPFSVSMDFSALARHRKRCNLDGCTSDGTMKCAGCNTANYCSKECQLAHWRQIHKHTCQNPTVESTFVPEIPSSWRETRASATTAPSESIRFARLVHDDTHRGKTVDTPAIYSMASRPSLLSYFEHHSGDNDASFKICLADGHGAFLSAVRFPIALHLSKFRNCTILSHPLIGLKSISAMRESLSKSCIGQTCKRWEVS